MPRLLPIEGTILPYAWGSPTRLAAFLGRAPTGRPEAELWLGTHPTAPSVVAAGAATEGGTALPALVGRLPWLLKAQAIDRPLSIQAHPTTRQARRGAGATVFPDGRAKPEMLLALEPVRALAGIRSPRRTLAAAAALGVPALSAALAPLAVGDVAAVLRSLLTLPARARGRLLTEALGAAMAGRGGDAGDLLVRLQTAHPDDPAILAALLLEEVRLAPGEAIFIPPRMPHAYLEGFGVEIMAASDDVVRGGLTRKPVDVDAFLAIVDATPQRPRARVAAGVAGHPGLARWPAPTRAFALYEARPTEAIPVVVPLAGPAIALGLEGATTGRVDGAGDPVALGRGAAAVAFDGAARLTIEGTGRVVVATRG